MIREAELFVMADQVLVEVLGRIRDEHRKITLAALCEVPGLDEPVLVPRAVQRHAVEEASIPHVLAGREPDGCRSDGSRAAGRRVDDGAGPPPHRDLVRLTEAACAAAGRVTDGDAPVHPPSGTVPARDHLWRLALVRAFLAHDLAFALGTTACPLTEEFARGALEGTERDAATWRDRGIFRTPLPLPDRHVSWRDRFLLAAGRDPHPGH